MDVNAQKMIEQRIEWKLRECSNNYYAYKLYTCGAYCRENRLDVWLKLIHAIQLRVGKCMCALNGDSDEH